MGAERAHALAEDFQALSDGIPYEPKGILFSEMLFLKAHVGVPNPACILESGRARGQSTHLLALSFERSQIVSVEFDARSEDTAVATARLQGLPNVTLLFGDSRRLLPRLLDRDHVVLIDGPKGWRSLRLAFELLATRKPRQVFVHDCFRGSAIRRFLDRHVLEARFSDERAFVETWRHLDEKAWATLDAREARGWRPFQYEGLPMESYGPTLACLPFDPGRNYGRLLRRLWREAFISRLRQSIAKRFRRRGTSPAGPLL